LSPPAWSDWRRRSREPRGQPVAVDRIVAVVNDEVITHHELRSRLDSALSQLQRQGMAPPPRDVLERQVLERLVIDKVQLQLARDMGLRVDDGQLEQALQRIAAGNKLSLPSSGQHWKRTDDLCQLSRGNSRRDDHWPAA
jgi:parvulin-like peptidyl-prolyl isomerase